MLDADLRGRVMETEFFWNTKETFLKKEEWVEPGSNAGFGL